MRTTTAVTAILMLSPASGAGDTLRDRVIAMQRLAQEPAPRAVPAQSPSSSANSPETFDQAVARLKPVRVGGDIPAPAKTRDAKPLYPPEAQKARVQGVVIIEALVDAEGKVAAARVLRSIPLLDGVSLDAVRRWRFKPTEIEGRRTPVLTIQRVTFTLLR